MSGAGFKTTVANRTIVPVARRTGAALVEFAASLMLIAFTLVLLLSFSIIFAEELILKKTCEIAAARAGSSFTAKQAHKAVNDVDKHLLCGFFGHLIERDCAGDGMFLEISPTAQSESFRKLQEPWKTNVVASVCYVKATYHLLLPCGVPFSLTADAKALSANSEATADALPHR